MAKAKAKVKTKAKAKAKKAPVVKEASGRRSKFESLYPEDASLKLLVEFNPKKQGSAAAGRFEGYFGASTVGDARAAGVRYSDIVHDIGRCYIKVGR